MLPNLIIVGAPKCGTSSIYGWLVSHPDVCGSTGKELYYLMDKGHPSLRPDSNIHDHGLDGYETLFSHCELHHKIVVEATTHYLYQQVALDVLSRFDPQPQIVVSLREPARRIYSAFNYMKCSSTARLSHDLTFPQFVEMLLNKSPEYVEAKLGSSPSAYFMSRELEQSKYIVFIEKWIAKFSRERIHLILLEDVKRDPLLSMVELSTRVGIDGEWFREYDFQRRNETIIPRNMAAHRLMPVLKRIVPHGKIRNWVKKSYYRLQEGARPAATDEDTDSLRQLQQYFHTYNQQLAEKTGLAISAWNNEALLSNKVNEKC